MCCVSFCRTCAWWLRKDHTIQEVNSRWSSTRAVRRSASLTARFLVVYLSMKLFCYQRQSCLSLVLFLFYSLWCHKSIKKIYCMFLFTKGLFFPVFWSVKWCFFLAKPAHIRLLITENGKSLKQAFISGEIREFLFLYCIVTERNILWVTMLENIWQEAQICFENDCHWMSWYISYSPFFFFYLSWTSTFTSHPRRRHIFVFLFK